MSWLLLKDTRDNFWQGLWNTYEINYHQRNWSGEHLNQKRSVWYSKALLTNTPGSKYSYPQATVTRVPNDALLGHIRFSCDGLRREHHTKSGYCMITKFCIDLKSLEQQWCLYYVYVWWSWSCNALNPNQWSSGFVVRRRVSTTSSNIGCRWGTSVYHELPQKPIKYFFKCETPQEKYMSIANIYGVVTIGQAMIFCHTRKTAAWLVEKMTKDGHAVALLSGELTVEERIQVGAIQINREIS